MKRKHIVAGVATLGIIAIAGPAFAAGPPYTVKVGTNTSGSYSVSAAKVSGTTLVTKINGYSLGCTNLTGNGTVVAGASKNPVASLSTITFSGCTINGTTATVTPQTTWNLTGTGTNATTGNETINGYVGNVNAKIQAGGLCSLVVAGTANGNFVESTQRLNVTEIPTSATVGNLKVTSVSGCGGLFAVGNTAEVQAQLAVTSSGGAINLS